MGTPPKRTLTDTEAFNQLVEEMACGPEISTQTNLNSYLSAARFTHKIQYQGSFQGERVTAVTLADEETHPELLRMVASINTQMNRSFANQLSQPLEPPAILIIDTGSENAFYSQDGFLIITSRALQTPESELFSTLTHEMGHYFDKHMHKERREFIEGVDDVYPAFPEGCKDEQLNDELYDILGANLHNYHNAEGRLLEHEEFTTHNGMAFEERAEALGLSPECAVSLKAEMELMADMKRQVELRAEELVTLAGYGEQRIANLEAHHSQPLPPEVEPLMRHPADSTRVQAMKDIMENTGLHHITMQEIASQSCNSPSVPTVVPPTGEPSPKGQGR